MRPQGCFLVGLLGAQLGFPAAEPAEGAPEAPPEPASVASEGAEPGAWAAWSRLDPEGGVPTAAGYWIQAGARTWEALPGTIQWTVRTGAEPHPRGLGGFLEAAALGGAKGPRTLRAGGILKSSRGRMELAIGQTAFAGGRMAAARARILIAPQASWLLGGTLQGGLGSAGRAVSILPEFWARTGPWDLGLRLGDSVDAVLGIRPGDRLLAFVRYDAGVPSAGVVLEWGWGAFRAEAADHPYLGRVAQFRLGCGGSP